MSANNTNRINTEYNIIRIIHNILIFSVYCPTLGKTIWEVLLGSPVVSDRANLRWRILGTVVRRSKAPTAIFPTRSQIWDDRLDTRTHGHAKKRLAGQNLSGRARAIFTRAVNLRGFPPGVPTGVGKNRQGPECWDKASSRAPLWGPLESLDLSIHYEQGLIRSPVLSSRLCCLRFV